jgi:hypothetical protein
LQVKNIPSNGGFQLPLTGGAGTGLLYAERVPLLVARRSTAVRPFKPRF